MLEILFLVWFCRKLSAIARAKGRSAGWGGLGAAFWIGGEISGFVVGAIADAGTGGGYGLALLFAVIGAGVAYAIVSSLKNELSAADDYSPRAVGVGGYPAPYPGPYDTSNPYSPPRT
jgi:hypothetical protein